MASSTGGRVGRKRPRKTSEAVAPAQDSQEKKEAKKRRKSNPAVAENLSQEEQQRRDRQRQLRVCTLSVPHDSSQLGVEHCTAKRELLAS